MKVFKIVEPVFKTEPLFVVNCSEVELRDYLQKHYRIRHSIVFRSVGTMLTFDRSPWRVVWIQRSDKLPEVIHELFHLVTRICQDKGVPIVAHHETGESGDETAAYLM